jgi:lincosamide nucleotidyltransferase A/C/D/E
VTSSPVERVAAAVGEGSMAIAFVHQYLRGEQFPLAQSAVSRRGPFGRLKPVEGSRAETMSEGDVVDFLDLCAAHSLAIWIDGGWGVDALLGEQTRPHEDLDIALRHADVPRLRALLEARGYGDVPRDDARDCNFVMGDAHGRLVDFHSFTFDDAGNRVFGVEYPLESLTGRGSIGGRPVQCIAAEWMMSFHTGYPLDEDDLHDILVLHERFGLPIPADYDELRRRGS